jgi:DNA-directed RNA polymerase specialized sigma24 family protein
MRRHLATTLKTAHQNRKRILNESKSLDQDRSHDNDDLSLINIVQSKDSPILDGMEIREFIKNFTKRLIAKLSKFEREVFILYVQKFSYEEIAQNVIDSDNNKAVKAIDNGLSRIKHKAWEIYEKMVTQEQVPPVALKWYEEEKAKKAADEKTVKAKKKRKRSR